MDTAYWLGVECRIGRADRGQPNHRHPASLSLEKRSRTKEATWAWRTILSERPRRAAFCIVRMRSPSLRNHGLGAFNVCGLVRTGASPCRSVALPRPAALATSPVAVQQVDNVAWLGSAEEAQ